MKRSIVIIAVMMILAVSSLYAEFDQFENWKKFKPGTFVAYKSVIDAAGVKTEAWLNYTLIKVSGDTVVLEFKTKVVTMGVSTPEVKRTIKLQKGDLLPAMEVPGLPSGIPNLSTPGVEASGGSKSIIVKGETIECKTARGKTSTTDSQIWFNDDFPGRTIKVATKAPAVTVTLELVDFKIVK